MVSDMYPWQKEMHDFALERQKCILAGDPGTGKTRAAIEVLKTAKAGNCTVVVPAHLRRNWANEFALWWPEAADFVQVVEKTSEPLKHPFVIISYDMFVKWHQEKKLRASFFIFDEAHYLKSPNAKRSRAGRVRIKNSAWAILLTGTPAPNRMSELGTALMGFGAIKNRKNFEAVYCGGWQAPWGWQRDGNPNVEALQELLEPYMIRVPKSVLSQVTAGRMPPRVIEVDVAGCATREKAFDKAEVAKNPNPIAFEGMSELMAWHGEQKVKPAAEHIRNVLESEEKVLVFYWHTEVGDALEKQLRKFGVSRIDGKTKDKQQELDNFKSEPHGNRILLANHKAGGTGLNITEASYIVFVEAPWSPGDLDQCISRCDRIGQEDIVRTDIITVAGSVDGHVIHAILNKAETIEEVIDMPAIKKVTKRDVLVFGLLLDHSEARRLEPVDFVEQMFEKWGGVDLLDQDQHDDNPPAEEAKQIVEPKPEPEPEAEAPTLAEVRAAARAYMDAQGSDELKDLLATFGAKNLSALEEDDYAGFMAAIEEKSDD